MDGVGYYPPLAPKVGVPTYALCLELMFCNSTSRALKFLSETPNAGAFAFMLGDRAGDLAVAEAVPGRVFTQHNDLLHRANVLELPECIKAGRQKLPPLKKCNSLKRKQLLLSSESDILKQPSMSALKKLLDRKGIFIEQKHLHASLFQLVADCPGKSLHLRRWRSGGKWQHFKL